MTKNATEQINVMDLTMLTRFYKCIYIGILIIKTKLSTSLRFNNGSESVVLNRLLAKYLTCFFTFSVTSVKFRNGTYEFQHS